MSDSHGRFEKPMDEFRQVSDGWSYTTQRRWIIQNGPVQHAQQAIPPDDPDTWMPHPFMQWLWFPVVRRWKNLPVVTLGEANLEAMKEDPLWAPPPATPPPSSFTTT